MAKQTHNGFKLLAIRPLENCDVKFRKNLKEGVIYKFYQDYLFLDKNDKEIRQDLDNTGESVFKIKRPKSEINLFSDESLKINISAIVGKNGSGKSSLLEMLYLCNYYLGISLGVLETNAQKLQRIIDENKETSRIIDIQKISDDINNSNKEHLNILKKFKASIIYELDGVFYEIQFGGVAQKTKKQSNINLINIDKELSFKDKNILSHFFYTVVINYSQYALNSNNIGYWINPLFHKNDAYLAPLVINPMRHEGNFNINREEEFALYRLLHNLLIQKSKSEKDALIYITENQYVKSVHFKYNSNKVKKRPIKKTEGQISGDKKYSIFIRDVQTVFYPDFNQVLAVNQVDVFKTELYNYIVQKILKIANTYDIYSNGYNFSEEQGLKENIEFLERLKDDNTHIAFKIYQCFNFLANNIELENNKWNEDETIFEFSLDELLEWMTTCKDNSDLIKHIPPPIFDIEIILSDKSSSVSTFSSLSSGELQLIHSIQSVLYHVNNLESVHNNSEERATYKSINIVYDEVELYFHPEYQQQFISKFINSINLFDLGKRSDDKGIKNINIIFSTHSPFILSDIPSQNILRLEKGSPSSRKIEQTFGANIHDLLANDFFLADGFMGEFARRKIDETIEFLNNFRMLNLKLDELNQKLEKVDEEKKDTKNRILKEKEIIENKLESIKNNDFEYHKKLINVIGEPVLRNKLNEMLASILPKEEKEKMLKEQFRIMAKNAGFNIDDINFEN